MSRADEELTSGVSGPQAVLWDMDGTLVDSEKLWDVSLAGLAVHLGGRLSAPARAAMVGRSLDRTVLQMFAEVGLEPEPSALAAAGAWLTERTRVLFTEGLPWQPGAMEALRLVRASRLRTALVTSTHRGLTEIALDSIGREFFDVTVCGDEVPATKPEPDPYLIAARLLGVPTWACLAVEDSPTGSASAAAAGCAVLVVPNDVPVASAPALVERKSLGGLSLDELRDIWQQARESRWSSEEVHSTAVGGDR
jgi:HAD superfamily hydrolase (TIGR01509 family)